MPYERTNPDIMLVKHPCPHPNWKQMCWTLHYRQDLDFLKALCDHLDAHLKAQKQYILNVLKKFPELNLIRQPHHEKNRE